MEHKRIILLISLFLISFNAFAQLDLITSPRYYNEGLPQFCKKYNLPDSVAIKLTGVIKKYNEDSKNLKMKYFGENPKSVANGPGSPYIVENKELKFKRDLQIETLLGKNMTNNLMMHLREFSLKVKEEALLNSKRK